jgi:hypothetical protein
VVWIPPNQKHWHGAALGSAMTHIAIQSAAGGKNVEWMEKVSKGQYRMAAAAKTESLDDVRAVSRARPARAKRPGECKARRLQQARAF